MQSLPTTAAAGRPPALHAPSRLRRLFGTALGLLALGAGLSASGPASAQPQGYPDKPIRIVAPFAPGGALDLIARGVSQRLQAQMGQPSFVDNRAGAAGIIGSQYVMNAPADGYTLLLGSTTTHGINPVLYKKPTYDAVKDFEPVSLIATIPHVLIVAPSFPANNLQEFIQYAKAHPGLAFGSAGIGSPHHLAGEMLRTAAGLDLIHVPYKGSGVALADLMGGQLSFMSIEYTAAAEYIKAGKVKAIAVAARSRIPGLDVATYAEQGMPDFVVTAWYAIYAPAKTPTAIVNRLSKEIAAGVAYPEFHDRLVALGAKPVGGTPEQLGTFTKQQLELWGKVIKTSGATADY
jgi:tripartite-type tricarboxylate transporter receptor subunit TctC